MTAAGIHRLARIALLLLSALLVISLLIQFFIAGMATLTAPEWWETHKAWVAIFQWLVVPLPVAAWYCGKRRRWLVVLASVPLLQIAAQYVLVHRALEGRLPIGIGLHAVNASMMLLIAAALCTVALCGDL
jgi:Family of unknown function (DUF6220)